MTTSNKNKKKSHAAKEITISFITTLAAIFCIAGIWASVSWLTAIGEKTDAACSVMYGLERDLKQVKTYITENNNNYGRQKVFIIETDNDNGENILEMFRKLNMGTIITYKPENDLEIGE